MDTTLLGMGIAFTIGHVLCDLLNFKEHAKHPRDWLSLFSVVCLLGHVVMTGELGQWWGRLT